MVFAAKGDLHQYLTSINPVYARYVDVLWENEMNCTAQLGAASAASLQTLGVTNPAHAEHIIAESKAQGKWSSVAHTV